MTKLYANPYDISAGGFYFNNQEDYETKAAVGTVRGKSTGQNWSHSPEFQTTRLRHSANEAARPILKSCRLQR